MDSVQTHYVIKVNHADNLRRLTLNKQPGGDSGLSFADLVAKIRELFHFPASSKLKITYLDKDKDAVTLENDDDLRDACVYQGLNPLRLDVVLVPAGAASSSREQGRAPNFNAPFGGLEEPFRQILKNIKPENLKSMLQAYEPLFRDVRHPSQIPDLMENVVKTISTQFASLSCEAGADNADHGTSARTSKDQTVHQRAPGPVESVHHGVVCDSCGVSPILGVRYKSTVKEDYDLCSSCHAKADATSGEYVIVTRPFRGRHFHHGRTMGSCPWGTFGPMPRHPRCGMRAPHDSQDDRLDARFVCDVSIFDGTQLAPGTPFTKIWRLRNSGTVAWPSSTKLVNIDGDDLGSTTLTALEIGEQGLAPEEEIEVSVDCVAPQRPGRYQSTWRLGSPWGRKFGHKIWVQIQVVSADTLKQPPKVDTDGGLREAGESSSAPRNTQVDQSEDLINLQAVPTQVEVSGNQTQDMLPPEAVKGLEMIDEEDVMQSTDAREPINGVESLPAKDMEESFVKVDVKRGGDESPEIQMTEMPPTLSEEAPESQKTNAEEAVIQESGRHDGAENFPGEFIATEVSVAKSAESPDSSRTDGIEASTYDPLLVKLETMGFTDRALNVELLKANALNLRKTVDALCEVEEWTPTLSELAEMGFTDIDLNRRLMFEYGGNLKRVVKELVQIAKKGA
ncbi:hypothetical protein R1sor_008686 [Riccia sorocarpa]|uniref:ZZ-type domain-containing protein n=1 Tax=Riccia sorocarpa TaxID=122646 RepID=A0ABD3HXQ7_9MARC